jgi:hypothetical protein
MELMIPRAGDFEITGDGRDGNWGKVEWQELTRVGEGKSAYRTRSKVLYSESGIYFLVDCEDRRLTCTLTADNADIYNEDVVEVFLWPDESHPLYFEYEISPLGVELPILVANNKGVFHGWLPWHYQGERKIRRATVVRGGAKASMAEVDGWSAEFYIPFALLRGMNNMPPASGTTWRGNIFRIDYDRKPASHWAWCPDTGGRFHTIQGFGTLRFA